MPKKTQRFRRQAPKPKGGRRLSPWLLLGAVPIALGRQFIRNHLRVNNPEIALRHGSKLLAEPRRVLAVARNLAVLEFLAGGTLRLLRLAGSHVTAVVSGDSIQQQMQSAESSSMDNVDPTRIDVQQCYDVLHPIDFGQGGLQDQASLERQLRTVWEDVRPDLVLTMDPAFPMLFFSRPRHTVVGKAVVTLARALGDGGTMKRPDVLFCGTREANVMIDMGEVIDEKVAGVGSHGQTSEYSALYRGLVRRFSRAVGRQADIRYGESFRGLSLPPLHQRVASGNWSVYNTEPAADKFTPGLTMPRRFRL